MVDRSVLAAVVVVICVGLSPQLFAVAQDQEFARVAGLNVRVYNLLVAVLAAVTVTVAMRTVGLLLVSALMVVPVATVAAARPGRSARTLAAAMALGALASSAACCCRAYASFHADVAPARRSCCSRWPASWSPGRSGSGCARGAGCARRSRSSTRRPRTDDDTDEHPHEHGDDCGHLAVAHGDHVDYVHDGHRHAAARRAL